MLSTNVLNLMFFRFADDQPRNYGTQVSDRLHKGWLKLCKRLHGYITALEKICQGYYTNKAAAKKTGEI